MRRALIGVAFVAACGSASSSQNFGKVSNDGIDAIKQWCSGGKFETETTLPSTSSKVARDNPNLLVFDCLDAGGHVEHGWVAIDSKTNALLEFVVELRASSASTFLDRVLVPALSEDQKVKLARLRTDAAAGKSGTSLTSGIHLGINVQPAAGAEETTWLVMAGYRK